MAISYIGGGVGTSAVTLPSFNGGDIAIAFAFRDGSTTNPSIAAGWTNISNTADGTLCSASIAWRRLVVGDSATGTFSNASRMTVAVYRGCEPFITPIGGKATNAGTTNTLNFPTITMTRGDSTSWVIGLIGHRSVDQAIETAPTGMTNRQNGVDATAEASSHDTNAGVASWSSTNQTVAGTALGWVSYVLELFALPAQASVDVIAAPVISRIPLPVIR